MSAHDPFGPNLCSYNNRWISILPNLPRALEVIYICPTKNEQAWERIEDFERNVENSESTQ